MGMMIIIYYDDGEDFFISIKSFIHKIKKEY